MHILIFYFSYLSFPFVLALFYYAYRRWSEMTLRRSMAWSFLLVLSLVFIYARFIERHLILVKQSEINTGFQSKLVVVSDLHLGVYKDADFLRRVVQRVNEIDNVDAVLLPGDMTYYPPADLTSLFSPLKELRYPAYAILGNHDDEHPGPQIQDALRTALESNGVILLDNESQRLANDVNLLGLADFWSDRYEIQTFEGYTEADNLIVMTHNPDAIRDYQNSRADLTISGHTHGGQIRLPFLYKYAIPCQGDFDQGLYDRLYVSSGLGEVGLPLRLAIPPTIDVLMLN